VIVGDDGVIVIDAQATPVMAQLVIDAVRQVTDKPIKYVVLSHYHAVRVLGASAYKAQEVIGSEKCRAMIAERGQEDWDSEYGRFPRLFRAAETSRPHLADVTFKERMTLYPRQAPRRAQAHRPRPYRRRHRSPTCRTPTWSSPATSSSTSRPATAATRTSPIGRQRFARSARFKAEALVPGRGDALVGGDTVAEGIALTRDFLRDTYEPVKRAAARGAPLKECFDEATPPCGPSTAAGRSSSTASPSTSRALTTRPRVSTPPASGPPSATGDVGGAAG
jgi:hypothetical protein